MRDNEAFAALRACFNDSYDMIVPEELFQARAASFNMWLLGLPEAEQEQAASQVRMLLRQAQENIRRKQAVLEETILANRTQIRANAQYGRF